MKGKGEQDCEINGIVMNSKLRKIIVWNVIGKCNQVCEFCYGPKDVKDFSTEEGFEMIDGFKKDGAEKIVFTGGEPLLREDLVELIKYAKRQGLFTILHTNGMLLTKKKFRLFGKYLNQINLPLDGYDEPTSALMRGKGSWSKVRSILAWLKRIDWVKRGGRIVISTVVTKVNKDCIIKIGKALPDWVYKWRIFQFKPVGKAMNIKGKYEILDEEFGNICDEIKQQKWDFEVQCVREGDEFYGTYYLV